MNIDPRFCALCSYDKLRSTEKALVSISEDGQRWKVRGLFMETRSSWSSQRHCDAGAGLGFLVEGRLRFAKGYGSGKVEFPTNHRLYSVFIYTNSCMHTHNIHILQPCKRTLEASVYPFYVYSLFIPMTLLNDFLFHLLILQISLHCYLTQWQMAEILHWGGKDLISVILSEMKVSEWSSALYHKDKQRSQISFKSVMLFWVHDVYLTVVWPV